MRAFVSLALFVLFVALVNACSAKLTASGFEGEYQNALCALYSRCGVIPDESFCQALAAEPQPVSFNTAAAAIAAVNAGKASFDATAGSACITSLQNLTCSEAAAAGVNALGACGMAAVTGTLKAGSACIADEECAATNFCQETPSGSMCAGVCTPQTSTPPCDRSAECPAGNLCDPNQQQCVPPTPAGAAQMQCGTGGTCQPGLYCSAATGTCVPPAASGAACDLFSFSCATGLTCIQSDDGSTTSCVAPKNLGDSCTQLFECGGQISANICDEATHKCVARPSSGSCAGGGCNTQTSYCEPSNNTCRPYVSAGGSCDVAAADPCGQNNECLQAGAATSGTCVAPPVCTP